VEVEDYWGIDLIYIKYHTTMFLSKSHYLYEKHSLLSD
jgi:hypothetical protein